MALTYEMTPETKAMRDGQKYPDEYRKLCSDGAKHHRVKNAFARKKKK